MTKQQIIILAALTCAVLCVLAGGAYVVISEERTWQGENATAMALAAKVPVASETPTPTNTPTPKPMPTDTPIPSPTVARQPTAASTLISKIENANGYDWRAATEADRIELCKWMDANRQVVMGSSVGWRFLFDGLNEFYQTDDSLILQQEITEVAAMLILMSGD